MKSPLSSCLCMMLMLVINGCRKDAKTEIQIEYPFYYPCLLNSDARMSDTLTLMEIINLKDTLEQVLKEHQTSKERIKSIKIISLSLYEPEFAFYDTMRFANFRDIETLELFMHHDLIGDKRIAYKVVADQLAKSINPELEDTELKAYVLQDAFGVKVAYRKRRYKNCEMPFVLTLKLRITADPF